MRKLIFIFIGLLFTGIVHAHEQLWIIQENDSTPMLITEGMKIIPQTRREKNIDYNFSVELRYPKIIGKKLTNSAKHFNDLIRKTVETEISQFKKDVSTHVSNAKLPKTNSYLKMNYELVGFVSKSQKTGIISTRFTVNRYERGMAHPGRKTIAINYELGHDHLLKLSDFFQSKSHYLTVIADYCSKELAQKIPADSIFKEGLAPKAKNYQNWNWTLSGLLITFDEAQVAARYLGPQQVLIPRNVLGKIITHRGACTLGFILCDQT